MRSFTIKRLFQRILIAIGRAPIFRDIMSDKTYLTILYNYVTGQNINWKNPRRYNEKLQWLKVYDHNELYAILADKYRVKKYVSDRIGSQYVIPLLGVWEKPEDIDYSKLPNSFVLKCNHDGGVIIVKDINEADYNAISSKLTFRLKRRFYYNGREWSYKNIKPCILCEEYLEDSTGELSDYKVMCFDGHAKIIQVHRGRFKNHTQGFYDSEWNKLDISQSEIKTSENVEQKPIFFDEMIRLSELLSTGIPHVRVDWYDYNGKLLFGEFTFYDSAGFDDFMPDEWNYIIGEWINLDLVKI